MAVQPDGTRALNAYDEDGHSRDEIRYSNGDVVSQLADGTGSAVVSGDGYTLTLNTNALGELADAVSRYDDGTTVRTVKHGNETEEIITIPRQDGTITTHRRDQNGNQSIITTDANGEIVFQQGFIIRHKEPGQDYYEKRIAKHTEVAGKTCLIT